MLFGAATHDVGKVLQPAELSGPGSAHEPAGHALLLPHGAPERLARLAGFLAGEPWEAFMVLDDELARIASEADARLAFQGAYPTSG